MNSRYPSHSHSNHEPIATKPPPYHTPTSHPHSISPRRNSFLTNTTHSQFSYVYILVFFYYSFIFLSRSFECWMHITCCMLEEEEEGGKVILYLRRKMNIFFAFLYYYCTINQGSIGSATWTKKHT